MREKSKIMSFNYILVSIAIILSVGYFIMPCYFVFGYGLGDLVYLGILLIITLLLLLWVIFFKSMAKSSNSIQIVFGIILLFFIWTLVFNKGTESPCI